MSQIVNAFTIDFEDWYQGFEVIKPDTWDQYEPRIERNCDKVLEILNRHKVKATFFVLGYIAENFPHLIKQIHDEGHEIGSHGYSHTQVFRLNEEKFNSEISRTNEIVENITGKKPLGFRAPIFSIIENSFWGLDVLLKNGIKYDSSIHPTLNYRYGIVKAKRFRHNLTTPNNNIIDEIPVTTAKFLKVNLPVGGGAYFRIWPYSVTKWGFNQVNKAGQPGVFYFHPWEIDSDQPKLDLPKRLSLTHYHRLSATEAKLDRLFTDFQFSTMVKVFGYEY